MEGNLLNTKFAEICKNIAENYKTLYVMGCFGAPMNAENKARYTKNHSYNKKPERTKMIKNATEDTFGFDCVNLIKGILWGWSGDKTKRYGGAKYNTNGVPDTNADGMIKLCNNVSTDFSKIEIGEALWLKGHIGVYIGNGLAVECTPSFNNCVQITAVNKKSGSYPVRVWKKHGKLPYIIYKENEACLEEIAKKVINGDYGNGEARRKKLEAEGYDYRSVQDLVNSLLKKDDLDSVARRVINGDYGNGEARRKKLEAEGYDYRSVQNRVNEILRSKK